jgi:hypothetical protein
MIFANSISLTVIIPAMKRLPQKSSPKIRETGTVPLPSIREARTASRKI